MKLIDFCQKQPGPRTTLAVIKENIFFPYANLQKLEKGSKQPKVGQKLRHFQASKNVGNGFPLPKYFQIFDFCNKNPILDFFYLALSMHDPPFGGTVHWWVSKMILPTLSCFKSLAGVLYVLCANFIAQEYFLTKEQG